MFTPAGGQSRNVRTTRARQRPEAPSLEAVSLGPPSYSYGSPVLLRSRKANKTDSNPNTPIRATSTSAAARGDVSLQESSGPLSLQDIEASLNRRRSLRSASRSVGRSSPSSSSRQGGRNQSEVYLDYEVTQSSLDKSDEAESSDDSEAIKETQYEDDVESGEITPSTDNHKRPSLGQRCMNQLDFFWFLLARLGDVIVKSLRRLQQNALYLARKYSRAWKWLLLPLLGLLLYPYLSSYLAPGHRAGSEVFAVPEGLPQTYDDLVSRLASLEKSMYLHTSTFGDIRDLTKKLHESSLASAENQASVASRMQKLELLEQKTRDELQVLQGADLENVPQKAVHELREQVHDIRDKMEIVSAELQRSLNQVQEITATPTNPSPDSLASRLGVFDTRFIDQLKRLVDRDGVLSESADPPMQILEKDADTGELVLAPSFREILERSLIPDDSNGHQAHGILQFIKELSLNATHAGGLVTQADLGDSVQARIDDLLQKFQPNSAARQRYASSVSDLSTIRPEVEQLIGKAIHTYSADVLARPDFAAYTSGARINPFLTSPTYLHRPRQVIPRMLSRLLFNLGSTWSHSPAVAIHPNNAVGMCWAFPGSSGQLCVKLSQSVLLEEIVIEHVPYEVAHDVASAPKDLEIWVHSLLQPSDAASMASGAAEAHVRRPPADGFTHLMDVQYDIHSETGAVQRFSVPDSFRMLDLPVDQVIYRFKSNWGHEEFTCIYRIRALGRLTTGEDAIGIGGDIDEPM